MKSERTSKRSRKNREEWPNHNCNLLHFPLLLTRFSHPSVFMILKYIHSVYDGIIIHIVLSVWALQLNLCHRTNEFIQCLCTMGKCPFVQNILYVFVCTDEHRCVWVRAYASPPVPNECRWHYSLRMFCINSVLGKPINFIWNTLKCIKVTSHRHVCNKKTYILLYNDKGAWHYVMWLNTFFR